MKNIIYSSHPESQQIKVWELNNTNKFKLLQTINIDDQIQPMFINKKKKIIYVGVRPNFGILIFKINIDGTLTSIKKIKLPGSPSHISTDKNFHYIFSASYNNSLFTISYLEKDGIPKLPHQTIHNIKGCHSVNVDLNNKNVFVPALLEDSIYIFKINNYGFIESRKQKKIVTQKQSGPRHIDFHPNKKFFYSINELNSTIDIWKINNIITKIQTINILPPDYKESKWASDIHITPNGKYLYACDRSANIITIFKTIKDGRIEIIEYKKTEEQPREFSIDSTGNYLIVAGQKSNFIGLYKINYQNGTLEYISRQFADNNPTWVLFYKTT